ncbi:DEAD/DEAH box helicase [Geodermatophilus sp. URMC 61]|uniref:DEAD/DEAH box helicase n=1 Tax=Geodermatophilus sp. URMC 61 TaxID=3423411 RepID=UPI00406C1D4B
MTDSGGRAPRVGLSHDGQHFAVTGASTVTTKAFLTAAGVPAPLRVREGAVLVNLGHSSALVKGGHGLEWDEAARRLAENRVRIWGHAQDVRRRWQAITAGDAAAARSQIADSALADRLDDHQARNVAALTVDGGWGGCVFDEQGTGKTVTMIAAFDLLVERGLTDTLLVVAPKSMVAEWKTEFERFTGDLYRVAVADGDRRAKARALFAGADVVVANYETLVALEDEVVRLARRTRLTLAVDESFNVKNHDARRTAAAVRVREWCTHAFVLCGTPAPNTAGDVIAQFDLVDFGYTFAGLRLDTDRERAREQIRARLHDRGTFVRNLKQWVLTDLPGRTFTEIPVELGPQQRAAYEAALNDLIIDLQSTDDEAYTRQLQSFLERRTALLRICADPAPVVPGYDETPAKLEALDALLGNLVAEHGEKVIVWSFYRSSLDRIAARFARYGLVRVDGSVTEAAQRREAVRRFQEDDDVRIFLGNPAAAGAGLTLHSARYAVYESLSNQAAHYLQSLDRIHRRGQEREVRYITLLANGTIEESEYQRLRTKAEAQADLLGDPFDTPPTRRMMLDELLQSTAQPVPR